MGLEIGFFRVVDLGSLKIEVSIVENAGYKVYFTATDTDDRRLWHTALTDSEGNIKVYTSISDAITAAENIIEHSRGKYSLALSA
jgi:hypothetical protein